MVDFLWGVERNDAFESFQSFLDSVLVKELDGDEFFPSRFDNFLLYFHAECCAGLGEIINPNNDFYYRWGLCEIN